MANCRSISASVAVGPLGFGAGASSAAHGRSRGAGPTSAPAKPLCAQRLPAAFDAPSHARGDCNDMWDWEGGGRTRTRTLDPLIKRKLRAHGVSPREKT